MTDWTYGAAKRLRKIREGAEARMWAARAAVIREQLIAQRQTFA